MKMKKLVVLVFSVLFLFGFFRFEEVSSKLNEQLTEFFQQGQYSQIITLTERKRWLHDEEVTAFRALSFLKLGKTEEAEREIELLSSSSLLTLDHIYYTYLEHLARQGETISMLHWLQRLESKCPDSILRARAYLLYARTLLEKNQPVEAIAATAKVFALSPSPEEKQELLLLISRALLNSNHLREALWMLHKIHRDFPQRSAEIKSLLQPFVNQIDLQGLAPEAKVSMLEFLFALDFHREVETLVSQVEEKSLPPTLKKRFFVLQAKLHLRSGNLQALEALIQKTEAKDDDILFYRGMLEQRKGRHAQAIQHYEKLLQLFPQSRYRLQAYQNTASCYLAWGKENEYVNTLSTMTALFPQEASPWWELFRFFYQRNQFSRVRELMGKLAEVNPEERNRALFWLYKLGGNPSQGKTYLQKILASGEVDYYYVRAWQELKKIDSSSPGVPFSEKGLPFSGDEDLLSSPHWRKYRWLQNLYLWDNAEVELLFLYRTSPSPYLYLELSYFYERKGDYRRSILYAFYLRNQLQNTHPELSRKLGKRLYPTWFLDLVVQLPPAEKFDPYLFLALVRAESFFQVDALSPAGAVGLAQVLPSTALWVIEKGWVNLDKKSIPPETDAIALRYFLLRPEVNLSIGAAYFAYLLERFQGNLYLAICAYNAGPGRISRWIEELPSDPDAFVEFIPFRETQNYLRRVMTNYFLYALLYRGDFSQNLS